MAYSILVLFLMLGFVSASWNTTKDESRLITKIPFQGQFISVWQDTVRPGRYHASPIAAFNQNTTKCLNNILTNTHEFKFTVTLWSAELRTAAYQHIKNHVNPDISYHDVDLLPMMKIRASWKDTSRPLDRHFRIGNYWRPAQQGPMQMNFRIKCGTASNCTVLQRSVTQQPSILDGLELEYTTAEFGEESLLYITGNHLLDTRVGRALRELSSWPEGTAYRYAREEDLIKLVDETVTKFLAQVSSGQYRFIDDQAQIEAKILQMLKKRAVSIPLTTQAWNAVLWTPDWAKPSRLADYLNMVLHTQSSSQHFLLNTAKRSAASEGVSVLTTQFFGVNITKTGNLAKIPKLAFLNTIYQRFTYLEYSGRFHPKSIPLYRVNLRELETNSVIASLKMRSSKIPTVHSLPITFINVNSTSNFNNESKLISDIESLQEKLKNATSAYIALATQMANLEDELSEIKQIISEANDTETLQERRLTELINEQRNLTGRVETIKSKNRDPVSENAGTVYTRWGRSDCPTGTERLYRGQVVGGDRSKTGGLGAFICMTNHPDYHSTVQSNSMADVVRTVFGDNPGFQSEGTLTGRSMVCALCRRNKKTSSLVIWGKKNCTSSEWTHEYSGIITANYDGDTNSRLSSNAICVDESPEQEDRQTSSSSVAVGLETNCDSLPCPPYVTDRALTCAVCTK